MVVTLKCCWNFLLRLETFKAAVICFINNLQHQNQKLLTQQNSVKCKYCKYCGLNMFQFYQVSESLKVKL